MWKFSHLYYKMGKLAYETEGPWASYAYGFCDGYEQRSHDSSRAKYRNRYDVGYESGIIDWEKHNVKGRTTS